MERKVIYRNEFMAMNKLSILLASIELLTNGSPVLGGCMS